MNTKFLFFKRSHRLSLVIVAIFALLNDTQALAATITLDPTFGTNGIARIDLGSSSDSGSRIALQPDGKIIMMGSAQGQRPVLVRYTSTGSVDIDYGTGGQVAIGASACDFAIQSDGKVVVGGSISRGNISLLRYLGNGALDNTFGTNGIATLSLGGDFNTWCNDITIQPDHKIVVFGSEITTQSNHTDFFFARFNEDGSQDAINFIDKSYFTTSQFNYGQAVAIQSDGKIVVSGGMQDYEGNGQISLARLNTDGFLDKTFGMNGKGTVIVAVSNFFSYKSSLVLQPDGKIVVVGTTNAYYSNPNENLTVARFNSNGTLDTTFGGTGIVITDFGANEFGADLHLQADGKILVVGTSSAGGSDNLLIVRYNKDGSLDNTFGDNGKLIGGLGNGSSSGARIDVRPNGKVIVSGSSSGDAFLARYDLSDATGASTTITYESIKSFDGSMLESGENSNTGGTLDRNAVTFNVGDDQKDRQYRGILSFNTNSIPDNALIMSAQVKIKKQAVIGTDPALTFGDLLLDTRNGSFSDNLALQTSDFAAATSLGSVPERFSNLTYAWYAVNLSNTNLGFVNKIGVTQFRVRFSLDDNDDMGADYIKFFSGNSAEANRPQLTITYVLDSGSTNSTMQFSIPLEAGVDQPLTVTSNGGLASASLNVQENISLVTTINATDLGMSTQALTYSIAGGADSSRFNIDPSSGVLAFISAPDFEAPTDAGLDNIYNVTVQVSDGSLAATQDIAIAVTNISDIAPVITSVNGFDVPEHTIPITTVTASDADLPAQTLTFSIAGGPDSSRFNIDPAIGLVYFVTAPDFEAPTDSDLNNIYNVTVQVSDGTLAATQDISFTVTNTNEYAPVITSASGFNIPENTFPVTTITASDADLPAQTLTFSIVGGPDSSRFNINPSVGLIYLIAAPDFEAPTDADLNNVYNVTVQVSDGTLAVTQDISFTVTNANEYTPVITSANGFSIPENTSAVATITASDADLPAQTVAYSIAGGPDAGYFTIDPSTGVLAFAAPPDFEIPTDADLDNIYNVTVQASDGSLAVAQDIVVTVTAVNDNPPAMTFVSALGTGFSIPENISSVATITATDADLPLQTLAFSIVSGADSILFNINSLTGELTFVAAPNFEVPSDAGLDNIYNVTVQVSDGTLVSIQDLFVTINPVNDNTPVITSVNIINVSENIQAVTTITTIDGDLPAQILTYSIAGGLDLTRFNINSSTGELTFITPPDFEIPTDAGLDNTYNVIVQVSDGTFSVTQDVVVIVSAVNDNLPVITSVSAFNIPENTLSVTAITAVDGDLPAQPLIYSIGGGSDSARFSIDPSLGLLTFITPPDFEIPTDTGLNNTYNVIVQASDGTFSITKDLLVTISNLAQQ